MLAIITVANINPIFAAHPQTDKQALLAQGVDGGWARDIFSLKCLELSLLAKLVTF